MMFRLGVPVTFVVLVIAILVRLELAESAPAPRQDKYTAAEVRLHAEVAFDCIAEWAYTRPGVAVDVRELLTTTCDPLPLP